VPFSFRFDGHVPLPVETVGLAKVLKAAGYTTGCFGKWGLGGPGSPGHPNKHGFDEFFGYLEQAEAHFHYPSFLWHNENKNFF
jgi:arylsulfatase